MKDKLNQFVENLQGQFVEVSYKDAIYQCMDLAYNWVFCLGFPKSTIQHTYAYEVFTSPNATTLEHFEIIPNSLTAIPQDGDLVVWSNKYGPAGHIAIALGGGNTDKFWCFEQNNPLGSNAHLRERSYTNVLGWLRPRIPQEVPELSWLRQMYSTRGIDLSKPEGDVRGRVQEIFDGNDKYAEAVKQKDRALADLAEARGDSTKWEENYLMASKQISELKKEISDLSDKVIERDKEISEFLGRIEALEAQLDPDKVIIVTRDEYARLTAKKTLDKFTGWELFKEIIKRFFRKRGD